MPYSLPSGRGSIPLTSDHSCVQFEAYKAEELPIMKKEYPGLRLQQYSACSLFVLASRPRSDDDHSSLGRRRPALRELQEGA